MKVRGSQNVIVFEGPDDVGKSSLINYVVGELKLAGIDAVVPMAEPGGTPLGIEVRKLLKDVLPGDSAKSTLTELLLFNAARSHLLDQVRNNPDTLYIFDRHYLSSMVYQGLMGGLFKESKMLNEMVCNETDYLGTVFITASEDTIARNKGLSQDARCDMEDKYGKHTHTLLGAYRELIERDPIRHIEFRNDGTIEDTGNSILDVLVTWNNERISK